MILVETQISWVDWWQNHMGSEQTMILESKGIQWSGEDTWVWWEGFKPKRCFLSSLHFWGSAGEVTAVTLEDFMLKGGKKRILRAPKICEVQNSFFFWEVVWRNLGVSQMFWFSFSFKQKLLRSYFGGWQIFLLKVKPKLQMKCKFFNSAQVNWVIWSGSLSLCFPFPHFSKQHGSGRHCPSPGCLPAPHLPSDREWNVEMKGFLLEMEWWHPALSAQLPPPPLKWRTSQSSHALVCRQLWDLGEEPRLVLCSVGGWIFCQVLGFGYFALCETMRIFSLVSVRLSCLLCCALWSGALAHPEDLHNSHTTLGKSRTWETSYLSCRLPLWKTAVGFCFHLSLQATDGVEGSGTFSLRAGRAAVLQIFLGPLLSVSLPLLERTGLTDSKLSLLVLRLKQLTGDLMVSEINLLLSWILPFSGMFVKQVSAVAQGNEV